MRTWPRVLIDVRGTLTVDSVTLASAFANLRFGLRIRNLVICRIEFYQFLASLDRLIVFYQNREDGAADTWD